MVRHVVRSTIFDTVPVLYSREQAEAIEATTPAYLRKAKIYGIPKLGSGAVFPLDLEEDVRCKPIPIPPHWRQIVGIDFGWDHPFAAVRLAYDADNDVIYVVNEYRKREATPIIHAAAIKPWGEWLPVAWPHDGLQHDKRSGEQLAVAYRAQGLNMLEEHAQFDNGGGYGVEAGVIEMLDRMQTGRWKCFETCGAWLDEAATYHRENGQIVALRDDLVSASRYGLMMLRYAMTDPGPRSDLNRPMFANVGTLA